MSRYDGGLRLYQGDGHYWRGNDISEEPDWQRWDEKGGELEVGSAADWVCAVTRVVLMSTPLNRGTVLTTPLLSASLQRRGGGTSIEVGRGRGEEIEGGRSRREEEKERGDRLQHDGVGREGERVGKREG